MLTPTQAERLNELVDEEFNKLWKWFSCGYKYKVHDKITMLERTTELGVPYQVGCMMDTRLEELRELSNALTDIEVPNG